MKNKKFFIPLFILAVIFGVACKKEFSSSYYDAPNLPETPYDYKSGYQIIAGGNPTSFFPEVTDAGATLGRVLFYDKKLSVTNNVSCGSCHKQNLGFADNAALSKGFEHKETTRNSMSLATPALATSYFWDMRAQQLEEQVLMPVENHIEMGFKDFEYLEQKLAKIEYYPPLFEAAFNSPTISKERIALALAQFLRSMVSINSKFDTHYNDLNPNEERGKFIFQDKGKCSSCHILGNFGYTRADNIGLDINYTDKGLGALSGNENFEGYFKVPNLRNVALTAPYMHDGRFATLEEVIEHYNTGIQAHPRLSWQLREISADDELTFVDGQLVTEGPVVPVRLNLSEQEKKDLIAFLRTLTDETFIRDPKFSNPF